MNTCQLNKIFYKNKCFKGVYACDQLPCANEFKLPYGFIVNTDIAAKPGEHWLALYVDEEQHTELFDSFGKPPTSGFIVNFIEQHSSSSCYNTVRIQSDISQKCGQFSAAFIKARFSGLSSEDYINLFDLNNLEVNDIIVEQLIKNCQAYKNAYSSC